MLGELFSMERIFGFCDKICYFLVVNFLGMMCITPVWLFLIFVGTDQIRSCLPLFLLCMAFVPPSLSALFYSMLRVLAGTERGPVKDFVHGYRTDLVQKLRLSALQMAVILILWTNVEFFAKQIVVLPLMLFFGIVLLLVILVTPTLYLLAARYQMSNRKLIQAAFMLMITRPVCTLGNTAALGLVLMAFELQAGTAVLFMAAVYALLVTVINKHLLNTLEREKENGKTLL